MKKFILLTITSTLLSGCAVVQQAQLNSGMQQAEQAMARCGSASLPPEISQAWETVSQENETSCPSGTDNDPLPQSKALEKNNCWTNLVNKYVRPVTKHPKELDGLLNTSSTVAKDYRDGKIDRTASNQKMEMAWLNYAQHEVSYYRLAQCKNSALQQHVLPSYPHKGLLLSFMSKQSEIGLRADEGKISQAQADIEIQQAFASLMGAEQQANAAVQQQNAQAWQQTFENLQRMENTNQGKSCNSVSIPPIATAGCKNVCINGSWAEIC